MDVFKTLILDTPTVEGATGTVTSVDLTAGTGISVSGGPITSSGSITVTNTAPDQTVSIASGTGISVTGSYPSFTVTNSSPSLGGDVVGPASATDNAVVRFDSTTGKLIQDSGVSISDANLLTTTALTVNDNTILGSSNTDTVNFNARVSSEFTPATDNTYDLGRTGHEWRDLYINGTANIDSLVADTADVNGGTIDGATIGASTASSGAFTTLSASDDVNFDSGTLFVDASADSVGIGTTSPSSKLAVGGNPPTAGAIAGVGSSGGISLALSDNVNNSLYVKHVASSAATIGTDAGGQLAFATNGFTEAMRIDSSGNVGIGTSTVESGFKLHVTGNGFFSQSSGTVGKVVVDNADQRLLLGSYYEAGVGQYSFISSTNNAETGNLPLLFQTGTTERMRIDASGNVGIGTSSPSAKLDVTGSGSFSNASGNVTLSVGSFNGAAARDNAIRIDTAGADNTATLRFTVGGSDDWAVRTRTSTGLEFVKGSTIYGTWLTTGLAVTGALSATGSVSSGVGLTGASGRHVVDMLQGGYSVPGDYNTAANGDKFIAYLGDSYDARIGVGTSADMWFKSAGNAAASFGFYTGATTLTKRVDISSTGLDVTGAITATGNITAYYSDDRLKTKLGNIENALDKVSKLNGFYYEANETAQALGYKPVREVGLSAQQVEAVLPEVVAPAPIDNEYKTLHYERVIPLLVEAIKELKAEIELLKK